MVSICLIGVSRRVLHGPLAHIAMLQTGHLAFREDAVRRVGAPGDEPNAGVSASHSTHVYNIGCTRSRSRIDSAISRGKAGKAFRVNCLIAIDKGCCDLLVHSLQESNYLT